MTRRRQIDTPRGTPERTGAAPPEGAASAVAASAVEQSADEAFARRAAELLEAGNARLDAATRSRLRRARAAALAQRARSRRWSLLPTGAAGAAAAGLAASVLVLFSMPLIFDGARPGGGPAPAVTGQAGPGEDLEIVLNVENFEMVEDLEFFEWLAAQPEVI